MEKIIVAPDAGQINMQVFDFTRSIVKLIRPKMTSMFAGKVPTPEAQLMEIISCIHDNITTKVAGMMKRPHKSIYLLWVPT